MEDKNMRKKTMKLMSILGGISSLLTAGVIGYVCGDCYVDMELILQLLLFFVPPIIGSVCMTAIFMANREQQTEVIEIIEEA